MHPKVVESFWSDPEIARFEGAALAEVRLTFLWAVTNPSTNVLGIFPVNPRRFAFDTGLPPEALERTMLALPKPFLPDTDDAGNTFVLLRHYIRYQYGVGEKLAKNNMAKTLRKDLALARPRLADAIRKLYPELDPLRSPNQALPKGSTPQSNQGSHQSSVLVPHGTNAPLDGSPPQGLTKPPATETEKETAKATATATATETGSSSPPGSSEVIIPSLAEVIAHGVIVGVEEETCRRFHEYHESRGWMSGNTPLRKPLALLQGYAQERRTIKKPGRGTSARLDTSESADDIRAALQSERDPARRAALEKQLQALTA